MHRRSTRWLVFSGTALAALAIAVPVGLGRGTAAPNAAAGKAAFLTSCRACHTLKAAGAVGNIGPNLDKVKLTQAQLVTAITKGGKAVMKPADYAKYKAHMNAYGGQLSASVIANIAAFVYASTH